MSDPLPVLGRVASGIYILTAGKGEQATGMLASWVMQGGLEPPMVTVAVRKGRYVADWITAGQPFVLNVVGADQKHLLKHFGRGFEPGQPAFVGLETMTTSCGVPALADSVGYLECEPTDHVDSADHRIFVAKVTAGALMNDMAPMTHIRKSGGNY
jgi:flavin reductase (DIM6/NTAB) family NADH-FMN oxidoreductase RutF